ncbi:hypothetical protein B0T16DRAFT_196787 [Cercophora newfieldiana]|uniref:Ankyrin repeat protein n=1 Tax=Cercophora newfieldiana TaxID=92897 RepID=A0AA39Y1S7_9PEZI|nr:hypothetical protein B0T16DRAFT_196787 [Cercophora newfieldiana]
MDVAAPIATRVGSVERRFSAILDRLDSRDGNEDVAVAEAPVADVRDKFRLWAGNIGARNPPESSFSLESRLATADELLEQVENLIADLEDALEDLAEIVTGNRENRTIHSADLVGGPEVPDRDEAHDILDVASECIRGLLRISILIRKATPRDRFAKAAQTSSAKSNPFIDQFDINHVAERYPKLKTSEAKWICERLGRAITKRRQFLRYSRQHRLRIAGDVDPTEEVEEEKATESLLARNAFVVSHDATGKSVYSPAAPRTGSVSEGAHTRPSTKASTLDVTKLARLELGELQDDSRSYVSASSSFQITGSSEDALRLPTLLEVSKGEPMFECPFCFGIQTISKELEWRKHAFYDLRAYVCTLGGPECENCLFGDSRAWFDHEMQCHRKAWVCIICQAGPFKAPEEMQRHAARRHRDVLNHESQIKVLAEASQRSVDAIPAQECPFCDEWAESIKASTPAPEGVDASSMVVTVDPTQFRRHLSYHQEQLALFAIPRTTHDDIHAHGEENSLSGGLSSHSLELHAENEETDPDAEGHIWLTDPPLLDAAARGNLEEVESLLKAGADPMARGETWADLWDAARAFQDPSSALGVGEYVQEVIRLANLYHRPGWGDVFLENPEPAGLHPDQLNANKQGDDETRDGPNVIKTNHPSRDHNTRSSWSGTSEAADSSRGRPLKSMDDQEHQYEYTRPASLARYDLENTGKPTFHRREELDKYYQSKVLDFLEDQDQERYYQDPKLGRDWFESRQRYRAPSQEWDGRQEREAARVRERYRSREREIPRRILVDPPTEEHSTDKGKSPTGPAAKPPPVKGILKKPTPQFPEEPNPIREGVAPHKEDKKKLDVPPGARWTKISRKMVNPEALTIGKERFEVRDDFVIVLRVLSKEEIQAYASATAQLRERRRRELSQKKVLNDWEIVENEDADDERRRHRQERLSKMGAKKGA